MKLFFAPWRLGVKQSFSTENSNNSLNSSYCVPLKLVAVPAGTLAFKLVMLLV
jgi:hypothetical protein